MSTAPLLNALTPHVFWLPPDPRTDRPVLGVVAGARATLVVDAGNSPAHAALLLAGLAERGLRPPDFLALTHWHWDHVFGTGAFAAPAFASRETQRVVRVMAGLDWSDAALDARVAAGTEIPFCRDMIKAELPDRAGLVIRPPAIAFETAVELDLGGVTCRIMHVGGDHAPDASVVQVVEDGVCFVADCLGDDLYHGPRRLTMGEFFPLLDRLLALPVEIFLEGHNPEPRPRAALAADAEVYRAIGRLAYDSPPDREALLARLPSVLGRPPAEDHVDMLDAYLAGRRRPQVARVR